MPITQTETGAIMVEGRESINLYRMMVQLSGLKLEREGLKLSRGPSVLSVVKRQYGLKGNRDKVINQFTSIVEGAKLAHK